MLYKLKCILFTIFNPSYWIQNETYSKELDGFLIDSLEEGCGFCKIDECNASINGLKLWIANSPYSLIFSLRSKEKE